MNNISKFELAVLGLFLVLGVGALILFAVSRKSSNAPAPTVVIWGTIPQDQFDAYIQKIRNESGKTVNATYVQRRASSFYTSLAEALAIGQGPDVILLPQDMILKESAKIAPIPFSVISQRDFRDSYIQEAESYMGPDGYFGIPFIIDPLVLYWNRDIFTRANVALPPKYWDEFPNLVQQLTIKNQNFDVTQSAVALGTYNNIDYAKQILSILMMQAGSSIMSNTRDGLRSDLGNTTSNSGSNSTPDTALTFYTQFDNPLKLVYSWNSSLPDSFDAFTQNILGMYIGHASDFKRIKDTNPNLNFDVTYLPHIKNNDASNITYGSMLGFAVLRNSNDIPDAQAVIQLLTIPANLGHWANVSGLPPVRRDLLAANPADPIGTVFFNSALKSIAWIDPDGDKSSLIFKTMIDDVNSGRATVDESVQTAADQLNRLVN